MPSVTRSQGCSLWLLRHLLLYVKKRNGYSVAGVKPNEERGLPFRHLLLQKSLLNA